MSSEDARSEAPAPVVQRAPARHGFDELATDSPGMARVAEQLRLAASCLAPIALIAEPGNDCERLARMIHDQSALANDAFVAIDAFALTLEMLEERVRAALDRQGSGPDAKPAVQTLTIIGPGQLERSLQRRLRVATTNREGRPRIIVVDEQTPLRRAAQGELDVAWAEFLSTFVVTIPPLRDRKEDLAQLTAICLTTASSAQPSLALEPAAEAAVREYPWPGNLAELQAVLQLAAKKAVGGMIHLRDLPRRIAKPDESLARNDEPIRPPPLDDMLTSIEARMVQLALKRFGGNKSKAADFLGISRARMIRAASRLDRE